MPVDGPLALELVYAVALPGGGVELGGLSGAAQPGEPITAGVADQTIGSTTADARGRFVLRGDGQAGEKRWISAAGERFEFVVRDPVRALAEAVREADGAAGSVPNDLIALAGPAPSALLVRSGDDAINRIDPTRGLDETTSGVRLPRGSNPWFAAPLDESGSRAVVTGFGDHQVYVVAFDSGGIRPLISPPELTLNPPFELSRPIDLDGDGTMESRIDRLKARSPQAITVLDDEIFAAYSGFVAAGRGADPPVYVPPVIAAWRDLDSDPRVFLLPANVMNPQELRVYQGSLLVVATGVLDLRGGAPVSLTPGSILLLAPSGEVQQHFELADLIPGSALIAANTLWISSLAKPEVAWIDLAAPRAPVHLSLGDDPVDSVFRMALLPGDLIAAPSFNGDRLRIIDAARRILDPAPFFRPIQVGPGRPIFDGLQIVTRRPGRAGVDFAGPDLFTLSGVASRLRTIELRKVLGP